MNFRLIIRTPWNGGGKNECISQSFGFRFSIDFRLQVFPGEKANSQKFQSRKPARQQRKGIRFGGLNVEPIFGEKLHCQQSLSLYITLPSISTQRVNDISVTRQLLATRKESQTATSDQPTKRQPKVSLSLSDSCYSLYALPTTIDIYSTIDHRTLAQPPRAPCLQRLL